jgi:flagellar basal-body rod protein FlgG
MIGSSLNQILHVNRSGMLTNLLDLDIVANNIANINTTGYKSSRSNFQELLDSARYNGVQLRTTQRFMEQGSLKVTGNPLDMAINGAGFFGVLLADGRTAYTRDGEFKLDENRRIVNSNGNPLVWSGQVPEDATEISVFPDGTVMALQGTQWNPIGNIQVYRFANTNALESYGSNLWLQTEVSGAAQAGTPSTQGFGQIVGRSLELSNVNMANEVTQMVALQRSFEMSLKSFQQTDTMISQAIHMRK